jgi:SAM-dependent methyltransferase
MANNGMEHLNACPLCGKKTISLADELASVWNCTQCGFFFDNPRPKPDEIDRFYSRPVQYDEWLKDIEERDILWKRRLRKVLVNAKPGSLLDVGAGIGQFLGVARDRFTEIAGTEVSAQAVEIASEKFSVDLITGRIESIDFGQKTFDNITLFHVLEHVHDPQALLLRCRELLSPGGMLFVAVPNEIYSLPLRWRRVLIRLGLKKNRKVGVLGIPRITLDGALPEIHLSHFTPESLSRALVASGYTLVETGLDQYYVVKGTRKLKEHINFWFCQVYYLLFHRNIYQTMWLVARK